MQLNTRDCSKFSVTRNYFKDVQDVKYGLKQVLISFLSRRQRYCCGPCFGSFRAKVVEDKKQKLMGTYELNSGPDILRYSMCCSLVGNQYRKWNLICVPRSLIGRINMAPNTQSCFNKDEPLRQWEEYEFRNLGLGSGFVT